MRSQQQYLEDILAHVEAAERFVQGMDFEDFCTDDKTNFAVVRAFEVIGEAVKNLDPSLTALLPEIPWKEFAGLRDVLIHAYHRVLLSMVWDSIFQDLRPLKSAVAELLDKKF